MPERFSASVADKHLACHASANLPLAIPGWQNPPNDGDTKASVLGSNMHEILERSGEFTAKQMMWMAEAMMYVAELRTRRRFKMEREVSGEGWWLQQNPKPNTKADVLLYTRDELHVVDYKFGGIFVDANDNTQGKYYSLAFLSRAPKAKEVHFHLVQPPAKNFAEVVFSMQELEQFMQESLAAEAAILAGSTKFGPTVHGCKFCPANPHSRGAKGSPFCPAMMNLLYPRPKINEDAFLDD